MNRCVRPIPAIALQDFVNHPECQFRPWNVLAFEQIDFQAFRSRAERSPLHVPAKHDVHLAHVRNAENGVELRDFHLGLGFFLRGDGIHPTAFGSLATPRSLPRSRVKKLTIRSASRYG